jgi:predicted nucleic acid-binding protein
VIRLPNDGDKRVQFQLKWSTYFWTSAKGLTTIHFSQDIAEGAARLRAAHNIRTPDAIQMATAMHAGASSFLTNDNRLPSFPNFKVLVVDELKA